MADETDVPTPPEPIIKGADGGAAFLNAVPQDDSNGSSDNTTTPKDPDNIPEATVVEPPNEKSGSGR